MSAKHLLPETAPKLFGANRKGQTCIIIVDSKGTLKPAEYLGSGRFTTAFRTGPRDMILYTFFSDKCKSILAQTYKEHGVENPHLPCVTRVGKLTIEGLPANIYRARYYKKIYKSNLTNTNKRIVRLLQEAHDDACHEFPHNIVRSKKAQEFNELIAQTEGLPSKLTEALHCLADVALDWGDNYIFDNFHTRNWGLNNRGDLVMIDPMFDMAIIQRDHDFRKRHNLPKEVWAIDNLMS